MERKRYFPTFWKTVQKKDDSFLRVDVLVLVKFSSTIFVCSTKAFLFLRTFLFFILMDMAC